MEGRLKPSTSEKSDVFALGLVVLKMCSFCGVEEVYDYERMVIRREVIERILKSCEEFYTGEFCQMVEKMLEPN
jgi:hypothetical protein